MYKLVVLSCLMAVAYAAPGYVHSVAVPVATSHTEVKTAVVHPAPLVKVHTPVVHAVHPVVPVVKTVHTPIVPVVKTVHTVPVVKTVHTPVVHSVHSVHPVVPVVKTVHAPVVPVVHHAPHVIVH